MISDIPVLENEGMWASRVIDEYDAHFQFNKPQEMWLEVITAVLSQPTFNVKIGDMGYVFRNMLAKFASSAEYYRVSNGVYETIISPNKELFTKIVTNEALDMKKYFYGKNKATLLEHVVPASVVANALLELGPSPTKSQVHDILSRSGGVAIVLRTENALLSKSKMPTGWNFSQSADARYDAAGIVLRRDIYVRRNGNIYR